MYLSQCGTLTECNRLKYASENCGHFLKCLRIRGNRSLQLSNCSTK